MHPTSFYHLHFITLKFNTVQLHIVSQDVAPHSQFYLYFVTPINSMCPANLCKISQFTFRHRGRVPNNPKQVQTHGGACGCSRPLSRQACANVCKCVQSEAIHFQSTLTVAPNKLYVHLHLDHFYSHEVRKIYSGIFAYTAADSEG